MQERCKGAPSALPAAVAAAPACSTASDSGPVDAMAPPVVAPLCSPGGTRRAPVATVVTKATMALSPSGGGGGDFGGKYSRAEDSENRALSSGVSAASKASIVGGEEKKTAAFSTVVSSETVAAKRNVRNMRGGGRGTKRPRAWEKECRLSL